jgi:dTMP kinase
MFISFEGIEGSGKSTQIERVAAWFTERGRELVLTKEPGGTELGLKIRRLLLDPKTHIKHRYTETLLFYADRCEHVQCVLTPALQAGKIVLCDRYHDSTIAYQVGGRQIDARLLPSLNAAVGLIPKLTILLDLPVEEGLKRAKNRATLDRFEQEALSFHQRVRDSYLDQAKKEPERVKVVAVVGLNPDEVFEKIEIILKEYVL